MDHNVSDDNSVTQFVDKLLSENNLRGAIDFAKRVQNPSPKLTRLCHFLANIVVQVSSDDEEVDWYTVLGVDPSADPKTMKEQYVQLAKGSGLGSREAHKLLNRAWDTLSDRFTRIDYDHRRRSREMQQNVLAQASSATQLIQPTPVADNISGNKIRRLRIVSSSNHSSLPRPRLHGNKGNDLTSTSSAMQ